MVHIIGEAGNNHNGSLDLAKKLVDVGSKAGVDSVKFQVIYPEGLYLPQIYTNGSYHDNEIYLKRFQFMLKDEEYQDISLYCCKKVLGFSASVFDERGVSLLQKLNADYIKIASCDLNNTDLILSAANTGKKVLISTGMATLKEIESTVKTITSKGFSDIVLMHCVSVYPAKLNITNLQFIEILQSEFGFPVGFSDHTQNSYASVIAVSMGVEWIEKHFTLNKKMDGFDHQYALEPDEMLGFVKTIRDAELACAPCSIKIGEEEANVKTRARRGLYAARNMKKGERISKKNILVVRPENSLKPRDVDLIIGAIVQKEIRKYEPLKMEMFLHG